MKLLIFFNLFFIVFFCVSSCKKDKLPEAGGTTLDQVIVKGGNAGAGMTRTYHYDQQNRIISSDISISPGAAVSVENLFTYDAQGRLASYGIPDVLTYNFTYDGNGRIIKKTGVPIMANLQLDDYTYAYDAQNRVIADTQYHVHTSDIVGYNSYVYDATGNITEINNFSKTGTGPFVNNGKFVFSYDNKLNPYSGISAAMYYGTENTFALSRNNVSKRTGGSSITSFSHSYYSNDLPQSQTTSDGNNTVTTTFYFK